MSHAFGLIGHPLGHSLSPFIHKRLFSLSKYDATYALYDTEPQTLTTDFYALCDRLVGCNVTIPHKQTIVPLLDRLDGKAERYQTVNTVAVTSDGAIGYNTDADGFLCALQAVGIPLAGHVLLLGAGGAATVFACEAALAGCDITVYNPFDPTAAENLCSRVATIAPHAHCASTITAPAKSFDLLLNATPVGMYPNVNACAASDEIIASCAAVFDAVYNPRQTVLLQKAASNGAKTAGGMAMLVWQAAMAHTHWYGAQFDHHDIAAIIDACYDELDAQFARK